MTATTTHGVDPAAVVHPTAVVHPGATVGAGCEIGPYCVIEPGATMGKDNLLGPHCTVRGRTVLGSRNVLESHVALGGAPQDLGHRGEPTELVIGDGNTFREFVTANRGTAKGGGTTRIGSMGLFMAYVHIAHDCDIHDHVLIANGTGLSGHIKVENHANIGGMVGFHHFVTVGAYSYIGGMSRIVHDVPPYMVVEGDPGRVRKLNAVGLRRNGFDAGQVALLKAAYRALYRTNEPVTDALNRLRAEGPATAEEERLYEAVRLSSDGPHGRHLEGRRTDKGR